jgi:ribosomal protein L19
MNPNILEIKNKQLINHYNKIKNIINKLRITDDVEIKYIMSKTQETRATFIGKLKKINRKGIQTNIIIESEILGSKISKKFYVFSHLILSVTKI